ncbi:unnamed protein product [Orchesella dallaii]|uniref:Uncharacterized protein n=1 Tax=Orchesella dallaii TaxID=48710 RepID=A0ABP1PZI2_9HEXA
MSTNERNGQDLLDDYDEFMKYIHIPGDTFVQSPSSPHASSTQNHSNSPFLIEEQDQIFKIPSKYMKLLHELDQNKELGIWNYLNYYESDKLVQEYLNLLSLVKVRPGIVDNTKLCDLPVPNYDLTIISQTECLNNFFHYFQCRYFARNIKQATEKDICVANPLYRLMIPQFQTLPLGAHKEFFQIKQQFGVALQVSATLATVFNIELFLLKIFNEILTTVKQKTVSDSQRDSDFKYFFLTLYTSARVEFHKSYLVKEIDWSKRVTKARECVPKWRKESTEPPKSIQNRYAQALIKRVTESKQITSAAAAPKDTSHLSTPSHFTENDQIVAHSIVQHNNTTPCSSNLVLKVNSRKEKLINLTKPKKGRMLKKRNENPDFLRNGHVLTENRSSSFIHSSNTIKRPKVSSRSQKRNFSLINQRRKIFLFYSELSKHEQRLLVKLYQSNMHKTEHIKNKSITKDITIPPSVQELNSMRSAALRKCVLDINICEAFSVKNSVQSYIDCMNEQS